ncbi:NAD(P)H-dependent oxidoreductase [Ereboglobus luteus]|uniref:NAD(P)H-dependent oxidoreductase n=1 Tax=Ereboglobus luteus TaxID=1796921 RepID=A0A2U8E0I6_9BACT|nr:NAD(P)H-dependent oxidoreductase [Ereboglobus luteus]AWI08214.1 NAD(P)H-dependent oxidoreductase [Ereboglobus luteus]
MDTSANTITTAQLLGALNWRYATKKFDASKKIPAETWAALEKALVLSPSAFGLQPWKFFVVNDPAVRARLAEASYGQSQPVDASHYVVFVSRKNIGGEFLTKYLERTAQVRGVPAETLKPFYQMISGNIEQQAKAGVLDISQAQQAFIALGQFMTSAALLGVDTCALGGIDREKYAEILGIDRESYMSLVACAAGYRAADDKYSSIPKVRFEDSEVITHV